MVSHDYRLNSKPFCPNCKAILDGATAVTGIGHPRPGDVTVCSYCAEILVFEEHEFCGLFVQESSQNSQTRIHIRRRS